MWQVKSIVLAYLLFVNMLFNFCKHALLNQNKIFKQPIELIIIQSQ